MAVAEDEQTVPAIAIWQAVPTREELVEVRNLRIELACADEDALPSRLDARLELAEDRVCIGCEAAGEPMRALERHPQRRGKDHEDHANVDSRPCRYDLGVPERRLDEEPARRRQ
jgi:hypothetical protein